MRFRIRARFDVSLPLGWMAVALAATAFLALRASLVTGEIIWLGAGATAVVTSCICPFMQPYGRGWKPALWAFGIMLIPVVLFALPLLPGGGAGGVSQPVVNKVGPPDGRGPTHRGLYAASISGRVCGGL